MFSDRADAGRQLAQRLDHLRGDDVVVLGLPRGGVPVAYQVAQALNAPLDVIVVRKLGSPFRPELAMGAIGEDGVKVLDQGVLAQVGATESDVREAERREAPLLQERVDQLRGGRERLDLDGRTAVVVDDGIATGSTARAACTVARRLGASTVVLAVPVAPAGTGRRVPEADEVICVQTPAHFRAVSCYYRDFSPTGDEEVAALLHTGRRTGPGRGKGSDLSDERPLRATFDSAAGRYQSARPDYPSAVFDDLISLTQISPADAILEVGCGPGKATVPLAQRGFRITAIELGPNLAEQARINLAAFESSSVVTASFEDWEPMLDRRFDLIYAATSWHWVDPEIRCVKAARLLRPGGHLAVWGAGHAFPHDFDPIFAAIQAVYEGIGEDHPGEWPPPPPDLEADAGAEFAASGRFEVVGVRRYLWSMRYSADAYLALLDTFSGHIAMEPAKRDHLYAEIRRLLAARPDGQLTRHWSSVLTIGRRIEGRSGHG